MKRFLNIIIAASAAILTCTALMISAAKRYCRTLECIRQPSGSRLQKYRYRCPGLQSGFIQKAALPQFQIAMRMRDNSFISREILLSAT